MLDKHRRQTSGGGPTLNECATSHTEEREKCNNGKATFCAVSSSHTVGVINKKLTKCFHDSTLE